MSFLQRLLGKDGSTQLAVDSTHFAARISGRPMHLGPSGGSFSLGFLTGTMAAGLAAGAEIFQFRWVHATAKCIIRSINISAGGIGAWTPGFGAFQLKFARSWTADGSGGSQILFATNDSKKRTDFPTTLLTGTGGVRISTTAALGAGTKTVDSNSLACHTFGVVNTAGWTLGAIGVPIWQRNTHDEYPIVLETNEGIVITATVPATGTWTAGVQIEWAELLASEVDGWA